MLAAPSSLAQPTLRTFLSSAVVVALRPSHISLLEPLLSPFSPSLLAFFPSLLMNGFFCLLSMIFRGAGFLGVWESLLAAL